MNEKTPITISNRCPIKELVNLNELKNLEQEKQNLEKENQILTNTIEEMASCAGKALKEKQDSDKKIDKLNL